MFGKLKNSIYPGDSDQKEDNQQNPANNNTLNADQSNAKDTNNNNASLLDNFKSRVEDATDVMKDLKTSINDGAKQAILPMREAMNRWIHAQIESAVVQTLERIRPHVKESMKDPDMFMCERFWVDEIVDQNWPDIIEEARFRLKMAQQAPFQEIDNTPKFCLLRPLYWIRSKYLYAMMPYDKTWFKQRKNPFYIIFVLVSLFPFYGVQPCFYLFVFLCIDKRDEFQLTKYILDFKKMQFITQGCMLGVIGYIKYFACTSMIEEDEAHEAATKCIDEGPGSEMNFYYDTFVYCLQVLLLWVAYIILPCSKQKGKPKFKYEKLADQKRTTLIEQQQEKMICNVDCRRGGVLQSMLIWDILTFGIATFIFIFTYNDSIAEGDWDNSTPYLFFGKFIYGILSFPYLIFSVPVLSNLLTRSKPTAYDKYGHTVPCKKDIDLNYLDQQNLDEEDKKIDIADFLEQN